MNFTDALMEAKRRAQLQGRPLAKQEAAGIAEGYAESATDRLTKAKQVALQEQGLAQQESQFGRELAQKQQALQWEKEAADNAADMQERQNTVMGGLAGAGAGAYIGSSIAAATGAAATGAAAGSVAPGLGTIIGAGIGLVVGLFGGKKGCIIVTACTDPGSYEVNVARKYRDAHLDETTLTGYYLIAPLAAALIKRIRPLKWLVKKILVDRLIDYGEVALGIKPVMKFATSPLVTKYFLSLCLQLGRYVDGKLKGVKQHG